ncbi:hypothetical protein [Gymnodinialimonas ceratoperidinii]|uniref:Uncharacterized protein n=1 Tax=Gymnodinialimonas ceratoperidinii TaxID=2856823 RepID=A0A8F6TUX7_9RHOB|nr:hypothetical protein [Gymnodinialimonas ceratoperidinii]QXT39431.1 hypothetical protein KYE46_16140 [Gymnodinialimonas ceratoperidinii]
MSRITKPEFVDPREAFQIVGNLSFGRAWSEEFVWDEESPLRVDAMANLRLALESGKVRTTYFTGDRQRQLKATDAAAEFFTIELEKNSLWLDGPGRVDARIHVEDLTAYIRSKVSGGKPSKLSDRSRCRDWIIERINNGEEVKPAAMLKEEARRVFPTLSFRSISDAREEAIVYTGRFDLKVAGRPKST